MSRQSLFIVLVAISVGLTGCHSTPITLAEATQVPSERVLAFQGPATVSDGVIVVTRDEAFQGGGCYAALTINGVLAARLAVGEIARFSVPAGEALLKTSPDPQGLGLCSFGAGTHFVQRETLLKVGETKHFRMTISAGGVIDIIRSD